MKLILDCIICVFGINTGRSDLKIMSPENDIIWVALLRSKGFAKGMEWSSFKMVFEPTSINSV